MLGNHMIKSWSSTQTNIALSSGEAEYCGLVKGASMALGVKSMHKEMGLKARVRVSTDASAAKGIASRRGLGKIRHIEVHQLWVQDKVASGEVEVRKVLRQNRYCRQGNKTCFCRGHKGSYGKYISSIRTG